VSWAKKNNKPVKHKYNAQKTVVDGITFDSKLESFMYGRLKQLSIPFDFQFEVELQPAFREPKGTAVRRMYMKIDFVIRVNGVAYFVDTKGFATPDAKLKYKMLKYIIFKSGRNDVVLFCKNQKEVNSFCNNILNEYEKDT